MTKVCQGINGKLDMSRLARSDRSVQVGDSLLGFRAATAKNLLRTALVKYKTPVAVVFRDLGRWWLRRGRAICQFCFSDHQRAAPVGIRALNNTVRQPALLQYFCSWQQIGNQGQQESGGGSGEFV